MKVEILKENLKAGLDVVDKVILKNLSLPILNNVLISIEDNFLSLTSTNLETTIKFWVLTKIIKIGTVLVPMKIFSSFIASLPNDKIIIEAQGENLYIECQNFKTHIQGFNPEEFPLIPEFKNSSHLELENQKLCHGLSQVIDIPLESQSRPEISGIYFNFSKKNLKIVSTDSFRLAEKNIITEALGVKDFSFIVPQKPARDIIAILENRDGIVTMSFSDSQVLFNYPMKELKHSQVQIVSRLIEGEYPNYQEIIPSQFKASAIVRRDEFLNQIKTASLFSGRINEVRIAVNPDKKELGIYSKSPEIGENKSSIAAKIKGEAIEVSFNYKFLVDGILNIKSSEIIFEVSKEDGPCVLRPVGDVSYTYVVMPIKAL